MTARLVCLALTAALLAGCGGGSGSGGELKRTGTVTATGTADAQSADLDMTDALTFEPNVVDARVGTLTLDIANPGRVPHNLVFDDSGLGGTSTVKGGATSTLTVKLARSGTYRFTCTFHPGMDGEVVVTG